MCFNVFYLLYSCLQSSKLQKTSQFTVLEAVGSSVPGNERQTDISEAQEH